MHTNAIMRDVLDADVLIAAPVAKTNSPQVWASLSRGRWALSLIVAADALTVASYEWYGRSIAPLKVGHIALAHAWPRAHGRGEPERAKDCRLALGERP